MMYFVVGLFVMLKYLTANGIYFTISILLQVRYVQLSEVVTLSMFV
jgi:prophage maintenance system killer protein